MKAAIDAQVLTSRPGGVGKVIRRMLRYLPEFFDGSLVVYLPAGLDDSSFGGRLQLRHTPVPQGRRLRRVLFSQWKLPSVLEMEGVAVLHSPAYVAPLRARLPVILSVYDTIGIDYPSLCSTLSVWHLRLYLRRSMKKAARIVVPTDAVRGRVAELLDTDDKIVTIPLGVDEHFRPASPEEVARVRAKYQLPQHYILYVGNFEPKKNLPLLIEAYKRAALAGCEHRLVLVGKRLWGYRGVQDAVEKFGVDGRVCLPGYVPDEDLAAIYTGAALFVFPSVAEGFGLPPLEAMACGVPVLTSPIPALMETTGDAAAHFALSSERLCEVMLDLLNDEQSRRRLSEKGLRRASLFTWQSFAQKLADLYNEVSRR